MTTMKACPWLLAGAVSILAGCGEGLVNKEYPGEVLTTLRGTLAASAGQAVTGPVSLAILWLPPTVFVSEEFEGGGPVPIDGEEPNPACDGTPEPFQSHVEQGDTIAWVSQSVTYQAQFPINFQIPVTTLPPANVRLDLAEVGGQGTWSIGVLVAYVDGNGNGQYDLGTPGSFPDQLIASSATEEGANIDVIFYMDGSYPPGSDFDEQFGQLPIGFSLLSGDTNSAPILRAPTEPIELAVGRNIQGSDFNFVGCARVERRTETNGAIPADAELYCEGDYYWWMAPSTAPEPCVEVERTGWACLEAGTTPPASWPCGS